MKKKTIIQSYVFDKKNFKTDKAVCNYLKYKHKPTIKDYTRTKRVERIKRSKFKNNSLRTKTIDKGVKVIKGVLK